MPVVLYAPLSMMRISHFCCFAVRFSCKKETILTLPSLYCLLVQSNGRKSSQQFRSLAEEIQLLIDLVDGDIGPFYG